MSEENQTSGTLLTKAISFTFHPLLLPTYFIIILFSQQSFIAYMLNPQAKLMILGHIFLTSFVFPSFFVYLFKKRGIIQSYQMHTREERVYPFIITALFFFVNFYLLRQVDFSLLTIFRIFILGAALLVVVALIINFWWKISIHMIGVGGLLGAILFLNAEMILQQMWLLILLILSAGLVGYARLKMNAHNSSQVYVGFLLGFSMILLIFLYF